MPGAVFLRGERVTLRAVEREDTDLLARAHNEPELRVPLNFDQPKNAVQLEEFVEDVFESDDNFGLVACLDEEPIGVVIVFNADRVRPSLAYWLVPEYQGDGYGTEAASLVVDHLFATTNVRGVHAWTLGFNDASGALLERLGFEEEGRLRDHVFARGDYTDAVHYGLLREEWEEER